MTCYSLSRVRAVVLMSLLFGVLFVAGCGSSTGPSSDKARLDLQDRVDAKFHGMLKLADFKITQRKVFSEDRVQMHITTRNQIDKNRTAALLGQERARNYPIGSNTTHNAKVAQRLDGQTMHLVALYKRRSQDVWKLANVQVESQ